MQSCHTFTMSKKVLGRFPRKESKSGGWKRNNMKMKWSCPSVARVIAGEMDLAVMAWTGSFHFHFEVTHSFPQKTSHPKWLCISVETYMPPQSIPGGDYTCFTLCNALQLPPSHRILCKPFWHACISGGQG